MKTTTIGRIAGWFPLSILGLLLVAAAGCDHDDDDHFWWDNDDIRITVTNNYHDDLRIQQDLDLVGWTTVETIEPGETLILKFSDHADGRDIRARDGDDTISKTEIRDGLVWVIP